jgi:hypothetical protein
LQICRGWGIVDKGREASHDGDDGLLRRNRDSDGQTVAAAHRHRDDAGSVEREGAGRVGGGGRNSGWTLPANDGSDDRDAPLVSNRSHDQRLLTTRRHRGEHG